MPQEISKKAELYRPEQIGRRELLKSVIGLTGGYAAANLFLGSTGLAAMPIFHAGAQTTSVDAENISYLSDESKIEAYLAKPKGEGKHTAVIVVHGAQGLTEPIKAMARRFAEAGFVALAPDLLSHIGGTAKMKSPQEAMQATSDLSPADTVSDLSAGFDFLQQHPAVDAGKVSSVGFSWGGWRSFMMAASIPKLYRAVVFYGSTPTEGLENIHAPVLAHYAQLDFRITGNALWTEKTMKSLGKEFTYYVYPNVEHAFFYEKSPNYNADAAKLAWTRTLDFLRSAS